MMLELVVGPSTQSTPIVDNEDSEATHDEGAATLQCTAQQGTISFVTNSFGAQPVINETINHIISIDEVANVIHTRLVLDNPEVFRYSASSAAGRRQAAALVTSRGPWVWSTCVGTAIAFHPALQSSFSLSPQQGSDHRSTSSAIPAEAHHSCRPVWSNGFCRCRC